MVYTTEDDVRLLTNLTSSDISDANVTSIIAESTKQLNGMINVHVNREYVSLIDSTRKNEINGTNTTFYVKNWKGKFIADSDDDGDVDTSDITVYLVSGDGTETTATISTITPNDGKFVLSTAPSSVDMFVTYEWCYKSPSTPDPLIKLACTLLSAAYCYAKVTIGRAPQQSWGNVKLFRHMTSFDHYYQRFLQIIDEINYNMPDFIKVDSSVNGSIN